MSYWIIDGTLSTIECLVRIVIAGICGALIGFERSRRQKDAGVRTHIIVYMNAHISESTFTRRAMRANAQGVRSGFGYLKSC